ncbi:MAG: hypothetical protein HY259_01575 [Chloroflexi bacterium]|nr:hypothetical protein [Chloroflexota bacterium]MBI3732132.1 hypothetical protein [Chloroflexota bacterium]
MATTIYEQLIAEGIKGLPPDMLAEIADFVYFIRKRALQPQAFEADLQHLRLEVELKRLSRDEAAHLEMEAVGW